jgi:hypothetical protein
MPAQTKWGAEDRDKHNAKMLKAEQTNAQAEAHQALQLSKLSKLERASMGLMQSKKTFVPPWDHEATLQKLKRSNQSVIRSHVRTLIPELECVS